MPNNNEGVRVQISKGGDSLSPGQLTQALLALPTYPLHTRRHFGESFTFFDFPPNPPNAVTHLHKLQTCSRARTPTGIVIDDHFSALLRKQLQRPLTDS